MVRTTRIGIIRLHVHSLLVLNLISKNCEYEKNTDCIFDYNRFYQLSIGRRVGTRSDVRVGSGERDNLAENGRISFKRRVFLFAVH